MKNFISPFCLLILVFFNMTSCKTQDSVKYVYADGNNNTYIIKNNVLEYKPLTPLESSSGIYSGGQPKTINLSQADYNKIVAVINKAIDDKSMHIDQRIMMSGLINVENKNGKQSYILGARSASKADIEALLNELLDKK